MRRLAAIFVVFCALLVPAAAYSQQPQSAPTSVPQTDQSKSASKEASATQGNPDTQVWVNTNSGVYHCPGTHWYGATKAGKYMKQSEAQKKGFRPAYYRACK